MKNLFLAITLLLLLTNCPIAKSNPNHKTRQTEKTPTILSLLNNPDVLWLGVVTIDYALNFDSDLALEDEKDYMKKIKFQPKNNINIIKIQQENGLEYAYDEFNLLSNKILFNASKMQVYKDADLQKLYSAKELQSELAIIDTLITFSPDTFDEIITISRSAIDPNEIRVIRVKQIIYYSKKGITFKTVPLAAAPLLTLYDDDQNIKELKPLFWFKPNALKKNPDWNLANINWAKRTHRNFPLNSIKVIKASPSLDKILENMLPSLANNLSTKYVGNPLAPQTPVDSAYLKDLINILDTIITFDSKTFEEIHKIIPASFSGDIEELQLIQDWIWDKEKKQLSISFQGFALISDRSSKPLFIRRPTKDK